MSRCGECKLGCNEKGALYCEENLGYEQCIDRLQNALYDTDHIGDSTEMVCDKSPHTATYIQALKNRIEELEQGRSKTKLMRDGHHLVCEKCGVSFCDRDREGDPYPTNFCPECGRRVEDDDDQ